jgi:5-methylcytosine-specific restriction protein B
MELPDYSNAKKNNNGEPDTFTYWIEAKLQDFGSIWGGSSFKFGIYSRSNEEDKIESGGRRYTKDYAWYGKYGSNVIDAFVTVRSHIVDVIEAVQRDDLEAIDAIDLGVAYKWKIAFHYQKDISHPSIINIFAPEALAYLCKVKGKIKISECHRKLLSNIGDQSVYNLSERLWAGYQASLVPEIVDSTDNRQSNLNTIYYGPPGTGKTYQVLQFLKRVDAIAESSVKERSYFLALGSRAERISLA